MSRFIVKYASESEGFGYIPSWKRHQFINGKEAASGLPDPSHCQQVSAFDSRAERVEDGSATPCVKEGEGREREGKEKDRERKGSEEHVAIPPELAETGIDPNTMARGLCERLSLSRQMGPGSVYMAVCDLAQIEEKRGGDLETLCTRMVEAYQAWMKEGGLSYRWGPAKFFGDGWWDKPETWPRQNGNSQQDKAAQRNKKWEEFDAKENHDAIDSNESAVQGSLPGVPAVARRS
jgi:hypothetical protein